MPIREKGYYRWDGEFKSAYVKWLPIFGNGIKKVFKKKWSKTLFALCASSFFVFLVAVYVATKPELRMLSELVRQIQTDALLLHTYYTNGFLIFMLMMLSLFAGADLISADLKFNSFTLYLSRPISRLDYAMGKFSTVLSYLLLFSLVPGLLLILAKIIFSGSFSVPLSVLLAAVIFPVVVSLFMASLILMLSSLSANTRFVSIVFIAVYVVSNMLAGIFKGTLKDDMFFLFSIDVNIRHFGSFLFKTRAQLDFPGWMSGAVLLGLTAVCLAVLSMRIKRAEV